LEPKLIVLREPALTKLGFVAERRMKIYTGRVFADVQEIWALEKRFKHLNDIDELFEVAELAQEEVA